MAKPTPIAIISLDLTISSMAKIETVKSTNGMMKA